MIKEKVILYNFGKKFSVKGVDNFFPGFLKKCINKCQSKPGGLFESTYVFPFPPETPPLKWILKTKKV